MWALIHTVYRPHGCIGLGQTLGDEFACKLYRLHDGNQNQYGNHHRARVKTLVEPTRLFRRQFILSHATLAGSSSWR